MLLLLLLLLLLTNRPPVLLPSSLQFCFEAMSLSQGYSAGGEEIQTPK